MKNPKWSNPKGKKYKPIPKAKYAMFNRFDSTTGLNEYILYDSNMKRIAVGYNRPKKVKFLSPMEVFRKTKGTMGLKQKPKYVIHPKKLLESFK